MPGMPPWDGMMSTHGCHCNCNKHIAHRDAWSACMGWIMGEDVASEVGCTGGCDRVAQPAWHAGPGRQGMTTGQGRVPAPEGEVYSAASDTPREAERIYLLWVR